VVEDLRESVYTFDATALGIGARLNDPDIAAHPTTLE
jgi:hypothetical protein